MSYEKFLTSLDLILRPNNLNYLINILNKAPFQILISNSINLNLNFRPLSQRIIYSYLLIHSELNQHDIKTINQEFNLKTIFNASPGKKIFLFKTKKEYEKYLEEQDKIKQNKDSAFYRS